MTQLRPFSLACVALGLLFNVGCGGASVTKLRTRAAFDMNCNESQIAMYRLNAQTIGVRGCGKQATYVESCNVNHSCNWIMNNSEGIEQKR